MRESEPHSLNEPALIEAAAEIVRSELLPPAAVERIAGALRRRGLAADRWLKVKEVAAILRVSKEAVVRLCWCGDFPGAKNFGTAKRQDWRVPMSDLNRPRERSGPDHRRARPSRYRPQLLPLPPRT